MTRGVRAVTTNGSIQAFASQKAFSITLKLTVLADHKKMQQEGEIKMITYISQIWKQSGSRHRPQGFIANMLIKSKIIGKFLSFKIQ